MCISCLSTFFFRYYIFYRSPKMREPTWVAGFSKPFIKPSQTQQLPLPLAPPRFPIRGSSDNPIPGQRSRVEGPGCFCGALRMADLFETNPKDIRIFLQVETTISDGVLPCFTTMLTVMIEMHWILISATRWLLKTHRIALQQHLGSQNHHKFCCLEPNNYLREMVKLWIKYRSLWINYDNLGCSVGTH
jgi:hypothetical protein